MRLSIYSKDNIQLAETDRFEYNGEFMAIPFVTTTINSPVPVPFDIGGYLNFRGDVFRLSYAPAALKQARPETSGEAFVYENMKFTSILDDLTTVDFLDVVLYDNGIHYSSQPNFDFYGNAKDLADRIQANLDRIYKGGEKWTVTVHPQAVSEAKNISVNNIKCWQALALANSEFGLNFVARGRTITIGTEGIAVGKVFGYGKGKGLYDIRQTTNEDALIITRLRAYGSTRNLPYHYYNNLKDGNGNPYVSESVYIPNLMLPSFPYTIQDPEEVYIDSPNIAKYGIREGSVYFDGSNGTKEIFPSLEGMTASELAAAGISVSLPSGDNGALNECLGAENPTDDGVLHEGVELPAYFKIYLKDLGFDLSEKDSGGNLIYAVENVRLAMRSGMNNSREFDVVDVVKDTSLGYKRFIVECKRVTDTSTGMAYPNKRWKVESGDKLVILGISMPEPYVKAAAQRVRNEAIPHLAANDETQYTYSPSVDSKFMAENPTLGDTIREGDIFLFEDTDLDIYGGVIIRTLKITYGNSIIPDYNVTLSNDKVASTLEKIQDAINGLSSGGNLSLDVDQIRSIVKTVLLSEGDRRYIRKDRSDETDYRVDFHDGITTGRYVGGLTGAGAIIDGEGRAEMTSLSLREFLEVPELRFNRVDVVSGELWNAIAFGLVEEVDEVNQIVKLKLEEGELSGMHLSDFCRGIFHNLADNETEPGVDGAGFDVMVGFSTSYFTPVEIIDNAHFRYELKPGTTVHPCASMKYAVYGNAVDKNRQASAYHTRTYTRYLRGVNTWKIEAKHISMQLGDLSNLIINGESLDEGSVYLNNVYFGGNVWYTPEQKEDMKGKDAYSVTLSTYSAVYNIADGIYEQADIVSGENKVVTGLDQVVASQFNISTKLQVFKGDEQLRYSEIIGANKYIVTSYGKDCSYVITDGLIAVQDVTADKAEIILEVNCEGLATYEVVFTIVRVADGRDGKDYEYIYTLTEAEVKPETPVTSQEDDFVPLGWTDDSVGPSLELPFEWVCKRVKRDGVWRDYSVPSLWARFGEDGTDYEYIYTRTAKDVKPSTPATSQTNDYIPTGWTDDPVGATSEYPYEWVSKRSKNDSVWSAFSVPALWSKFAEDGTDHEFIYRRTPGYNTPPIPPTSQEDDYVPTGWTDDPSGVTSTYIYEWMSKRDKVKGVWSAFSVPSLWAKFSFDGQTGQDGRYQEDRYRRSTTQPSTPSGTSPAGWSVDPPTSGTGHIWAIRATFNANGTLYRSWSVPVQWSGGNGEQGNPGPAITTRGEYSPLKQYVGNETRVDVVKYGGYWYIVKQTAGAFTGQTPSENSAYWTRLQGQFEAVATGLLIADEANIAGWRFRENYIESQNNNVVLDGAANDYPKIALGAGYANRDKAPTRLYEDGRVVTKKLFAEDGCTIGGFTISGSWLKANYNLPKEEKDKDGNLNTDGSYIDLRSPTTRAAFGRDLMPSVAGGASTITAIIENNNTPAGFMGGTQNTALYLKAGGTATRKIAADAMGNFISRGGMGVLTYAPINRTSFPFNEIHTRNEFYFIAATPSYLVLPTFDQITQAWGGYAGTPYGTHPGDSFIYKMTVVLGYSSQPIDFRGSSSAPLMGWGGDLANGKNNQYGAVTVQPGGAMTFFYIDRHWYVLKGF